LANVKIGIIGAGRMGEALIAGFLRSKTTQPGGILVCELMEERRGYISREYNIECTSDCGSVAAASDIIIVAVKPKDAKTALETLGRRITPDKTVVSIVAGLTTEYISRHLPSGVPIVRVMPNITCFVGEGMMALSPSPGIPPEKLKTVEECLSSLGRTILLEEKHLSAVTGLSGSGPAYIALVVEALADAGVKLGLSREVAETLAAQTTLGTGKMLLDLGESPVKLRERVVTPSGTTAEGLRIFEKMRLKETLIEAVIAATKRAEELETR
jgi:pyrroline-5-carboxylate reductase